MTWLTVVMTHQCWWCSFQDDSPSIFSWTMQPAWFGLWMESRDSVSRRHHQFLFNQWGQTGDEDAEAILSQWNAAAADLSITCFHVQSQEEKDNAVRCQCIVDTSSQLTTVHTKNYRPVTHMTSSAHISAHHPHLHCNWIYIIVSCAAVTWTA